MYHCLMFCFILLMGLSVNAATGDTINVRGKVTCKDTPVEGAKVTLKGAKKDNTTNDKGEYAITQNIVAVLHSILPQTENTTFRNGILELSLPSNSPVKVEIFDVKGNLVKKEVSEKANAGIYRMNIAEISRASKLLVIHASIGERKTTYRYLPLHDGKYAMNAQISGSTTGGARLAKVMAEVTDTLEVVKDGFQTKQVVIESYDTTVNIAIDSTPSIDPKELAVRLDQERQPFHGFGINATIMEGSLNWEQLFSTDLTKKDALGLSILRIGMTSDGKDRQVPTDWKTVKTVNPAVKVIGSCWSAPGGWKTNGIEDQGGFLKEEYYSQWAERIATYAKTNNLYAMSIANESDFASCKAKGPPCNPNDYPSMVYTGKMMAKFVKAARTAFNAKASGVKMIAPEASLWQHVWSNLSATQKAAGYWDNADPLGCGCFSNDITDSVALKKCAQKCFDGDGYDYGHWLAKDQEAWDAFDILGVHQYESQIGYKWPADVTGGKRTKEVWQTEMSGVAYWPEEGPSTHIKNGVAVARWIQSGLVVGEASAWCWWWYKDYYNGDNEGLALLKSGNTIAKRYYTFGNYSRYIRPGHIIVNITGTDKLPAKVLLTASKASDGTVVIVAVNETESAQSVPIKISGGTAPASFKPIVTNGNANWKEGSAVSVTDGVLTMQLEATSVTTFVGK